MPCPAATESWNRELRQMKWFETPGSLHFAGREQRESRCIAVNGRRFPVIGNDEIPLGGPGSPGRFGTPNGFFKKVLKIMKMYVLIQRE